MRKTTMLSGFDAVLKKADTKDNETGASIKGVEKIIKCHWFGKEIEVRERQGYISVSAICYLIPADIDIAEGDYLNGQPVRIINNYTVPKVRHRIAKKKILEVYTYA